MKNPVVRPTAMGGLTRKGSLQTVPFHNARFHGLHPRHGRKSPLMDLPHLLKEGGGSRQEQMSYRWNYSRSLTNGEHARESSRTV